MKSLRWVRVVLLSVTSAAALAACVGQVGPSGGEDAAPGPADAGPEHPAYRLSGNIHDYSELDALANTAVTTLGLQPAISATSDPTGAYVIENVPPGSAFFVSVMPSGTTYRPTINPSVAMVSGDVVLDLEAISAVYAQRQNATVGLPLAPMTSIVIAELVKPDGSPWEGVAMDALAIEPDGGGTPVGIGPYFVGTNGDVDPLLATSTAFNGRARAVFLNVPPGSYTLFARGTGGGGMMGGDAGVPDAGLPGPDAAPADAGPLPDVVVLASGALIAASDMTVNGATLVRLAKIGGGGMGGGEVGPQSFEPDIYPLLQKASQGGQGCASCHTAGGPAALLIMNDGAAAVRERLLNTPNVVNLLVPTDSLLLTKPLYESPPNHPNATWLDMTDPAYIKVHAWITQGAPQ
jgi:hypothetical protein